MPKKKIEVVELNKKEDEIVLEEEQSALILFWRRYGKLISLILLFLSLIIASLSIFLIMKNIKKSEEMVIREVKIETSLDSLNFINANHSYDDDDARRSFNKNNVFKSKGEVLLINTAESSKYIIKYYSDGTALRIMKDGKNVVRINPLDDGRYGIDDEGIINSKAVTSEIQVTSTKDYPWGSVTYLSDGSAIVDNSEVDLFVRDGKDIGNDYISTNKVTYLEKTSKVGGNTLNYYHDGTIEVIKNGKSYLVRTSDDLSINGNNVSFKNNNAATIYETKKTSDGYTIDYYTDGGAIIRNGSKSLSVRKSNSIIIKDNKIYEIVDNKYVTVSNVIDNVTYYTNGSAVVTNYNNDTLYVKENSNIKYNNSNKITNVGNETESLSKETNIDDEIVKTFENTAVIKTKDYIAIVPKDGIVYDTQGKIKQIENPTDDEGRKSFTITNNTNEDLSYCVIIEQSPRTTVDVNYVRYQLKTNTKYIEPSKFKEWNDSASKSLGVDGTNYLLIKDMIKAQSAEDIDLMLWTDYANIPNSEMDKYFYGTIKIYAWMEE